MIDPIEYATLRNCYWHLRAVRPYDQAARRKWYRRIEKEREKLIAAGASREHVRLYCRFLADPSRRERERALENYERMVREWARLEGPIFGSARAEKKQSERVSET